ncbi:hypothetical protein [Halocatena pleomorpha]|uniref:Uncharacterized protein n=1 Tax=Halocatena pleomorpha TaxID=1785090 RepID=A0A3P3RAZ7_9EURY|nr:hypothetical protein [Halocatena pleomorpha]RRJ29850.1 hypothetical protein EIK79_11665 [Halocatena pleomorpha]
MKARRPQDDGVGNGEEMIAFGIAALDSYLSDADVSFPTEKETLRETLGHIDVPYNASGNTIQLATALDNTPNRQFETKQELLNELHPVFERYRQEEGNPLLDRLRSVFPL